MLDEGIEIATGRSAPRRLPGMALWEIVGGSEAGGIVVLWQQLLATRIRMNFDTPRTSYRVEETLKLRCVRDES